MKYFPPLPNKIVNEFYAWRAYVMNKAEKAVRRSSLPAPRTVLTVLASLFFILLLLKNPEISIKYVTRGLSLCVSAVIPTLFPFMVLSELLVRTGGGELMGRAFAAPMRFLFGLSGAGSCAFLLGAVCGFPVGTRAAVMLYDRGLLSRAEAERLISFCNYPSSAFMISAVGTALWQNRRLGIAMYASVLAAGMLCGILQSIPIRLSARREKTKASGTAVPAMRRPEPTALSDSVTAAAAATLNVCAYVAFFSCVVGCITHIIARFSPPRMVEAAIYSFFELTSGAAASSAVTPARTGIVMCAAAAGWSGLSVALQVFSVCSTSELSRPRITSYLISKAVQTPLAAVLMSILLRIFPSLAETAAPTGIIIPENVTASVFRTATVALFAVSLIVTAALRIKRKPGCTAD